MLGSSDATWRFRLFWLSLALFSSAVSFSGCASGAAPNPFVDEWSTDVLSLRVVSRHSYNVSVFLSIGGRRRLLGEVRSNQWEYFEFGYPPGRALMLELESEIGETYRVPGTLIPGGRRVELLIPRNLRDSDYIRRPPDSGR
jgi:hypothetical protein